MGQVFSSAVPPIERLPGELLQEILSRLTWPQQMSARRVSRRWRDAVDALLALRHDLHAGSQINCVKTVVRMMRLMPLLRSLCIEQIRWSLVHLVSYELLLTVMPLAGVRYPLRELSLSHLVEDYDVAILLPLLPNLRKLHLPHMIFFSDNGEFLSLLPPTLQSLSLTSAPNPASLRQLARCPELRELRIYQLSHEQLAAALSACPRLERLWVSCPPPPTSTVGGAAMLSQCRQLKELYISRDPSVMVSELDILDLLTACSRLERLVIRNCEILLPTFAPRNQGLRQQGITHLELRFTGVDDETLSRLADFLPGLRHLKLVDWGLSSLVNQTQCGLVNGLRRFNSLQVLHLEFVHNLNPRSPLFAWLSELPLQALSYSGLTVDAHEVAAMLRGCATLTLLHLPRIEPESFRSLVGDLAADPPERRGLTLMSGCSVVHEIQQIASNIRVVAERPGDWEKASGWAQWTYCCCTRGLHNTMDTVRL